VVLGLGRELGRQLAGVVQQHQLVNASALQFR
jgi:hypothetical protein